jgi:hypothetical protein
VAKRSGSVIPVGSAQFSGIKTHKAHAIYPICAKNDFCGYLTDYEKAALNSNYSRHELVESLEYAKLSKMLLAHKSEFKKDLAFLRLENTTHISFALSKQAAVSSELSAQIVDSARQFQELLSDPVANQFSEGEYYAMSRTILAETAGMELSTQFNLDVFNQR